MAGVDGREHGRVPWLSVTNPREARQLSRKHQLFPRGHFFDSAFQPESLDTLVHLRFVTREQADPFDSDIQQLPLIFDHD